MLQPEVIDCLQFARGALELQGFLGMEQLPRLAQMQCSTEDLEYSLRGGLNASGKPFLRVSAGGAMRLVCQRCLDTFEFPLAIDVELQVTESLREIEAADDDVDRVLASPATDVGRLIEDEVILALPMVPRHERCVAVGAGVTAKISPFSALAALKRGGRRQ